MSNRHMSARQLAVLRAVSNGDIGKGMPYLQTLNQTTFRSMLYRNDVAVDQSGNLQLTEGGIQEYDRFLTDQIPLRKNPAELSRTVQELLNRQLRESIRKQHRKPMAKATTNREVA